MSSKLERYINSKLHFHFGQLTIHCNYRPVWLQNEEGNRLELDFFIPVLNIAVEVQGDQHYEFSSFMHGTHTAFLKRKRDDQRKRDICSARGIELIEVRTRAEVRNLIKRLEEHRRPASTLPPMHETHDPVDNTIFISGGRRRDYATGYGTLLSLLMKRRIILENLSRTTQAKDRVGQQKGLDRVNEKIRKELASLEKRKKLPAKEILRMLDVS